jgi:hypothetical protein
MSHEWTGLNCFLVPLNPDCGQKKDKTGFIQLLDVYVKHELVVAHGEHVL